MEENEETGVIYCIINIINGKKYIGQALSYVYKKGKLIRHGTVGRYKCHKNSALKGSDACPKLYAAMRKYGVDNFKIELIKICLFFHSCTKPNLVDMGELTRAIMFKSVN